MPMLDKTDGKYSAAVHRYNAPAPAMRQVADIAGGPNSHAMSYSELSVADTRSLCDFGIGSKPINAAFKSVIFGPNRLDLWLTARPLTE